MQKGEDFTIAFDHKNRLFMNLNDPTYLSSNEWPQMMETAILELLYVIRFSV